jgi:hypothetical protein
MQSRSMNVPLAGQRNAVDRTTSPRGRRLAAHRVTCGSDDVIARLFGAPRVAISRRRRERAPRHAERHNEQAKLVLPHPC